jgi:hypothetical protein
VRGDHGRTAGEWRARLRHRAAQAGGGDNEVKFVGAEAMMPFASAAARGA